MNEGLGELRVPQALFYCPFVNKVFFILSLHTYTESYKIKKDVIIRQRFSYGL